MLNRKIATFNRYWSTFGDSMFIQLFASSLTLYLLLGFTAGEDVQMIDAYPGNSCTLKCTAKSKPGIQYMRVRWHRVEKEQTHVGLITKTLPNGTTKMYVNVDRDVKFLGDSYDMILPNVSCSDHAVFACFLSAPVGHQNQEGRIQLNVQGCRGNQPKNASEKNYLLIIIIFTTATIAAFLLLVIIYGYLKISSKERKETLLKPSVEKTSLNAPLKPLKQEDLNLINTLGSKGLHMNV